MPVPLYDPANRVRNPGFEQGMTYWSFTGGTHSNTTLPYEGLQTLGLYGQKGGVGDTGSSAIGVIVNLLVNQTYNVYYYVRYRPGGTGSLSLSTSVDRGDGSFLGIGGAYTSTSTVWTLRGPFSFVAQRSGLGRLQFNVPLPGGFLVIANYDIDAVVVEEVSTVAPANPSEDMTLAENTPGPPVFQRGVYDDVHGTLHKEGAVQRDFDQRLRDKRDFVLPDNHWLWSPSRRTPRRPL